MDGFLFDAFVYLLAAVVAVPVAKRLGLGSVLGYLIAGILIGPALGLVGSETEELQHFAELGVVMMLFLVGLEMEPKLLWEMRSKLVGLGGLQVGLTAVLIGGAAMLLGASWQLALTVGMIFSLSSTAIVLQTLAEKGLTSSEGGRASFAVLLLQDIAVIPMFPLIPLLAVAGAAGQSSGGEPAVSAVEAGAHAAATLVDGLPAWGAALVVLGAVALVVLGGHFLTRPLFRMIADLRVREIFTASALLLVVATALVTTMVGLSPALGTFLAGVVLATSEFRHELEADIEPFKGLLLGLFFITVGAGIDFGILSEHLWSLLGITLGIMALKTAVLLLLARPFGLQEGDRWLFALALAQAGELGFVLIAFSVQSGVMAGGLGKTLSLAVALSMLLTPALFLLYERLAVPRLAGLQKDREADAIDERGTVVIAGIGRFGQIVNRLLVAAGVRTVVLDQSASHLDLLRKLGIKGYYGDASRLDLLLAAGIDQASLFVVAVDDRDKSLEMVELVRRAFPQVKILARAYDVRHLYLLRRAGVHYAVREVFDGSLALAMEALRSLGTHPFEVERLARAFRRHEEQGLDSMYDVWDLDPDIARNQALQARLREHVGTLQAALAFDRMHVHDRTERSWTPPPKGFVEELDS
jgi:monovalent cation:H+ antiporter-2, CPA2 family